MGKSKVLNQVIGYVHLIPCEQPAHWVQTSPSFLTDFKSRSPSRANPALVASLSLVCYIVFISQRTLFIPGPRHSLRIQRLEVQEVGLSEEAR